MISLSLTEALSLAVGSLLLILVAWLAVLIDEWYR